MLLEECPMESEPMLLMPLSHEEVTPNGLPCASMSPNMGVPSMFTIGFIGSLWVASTPRK